jgi:hypothetical protein
MIIRIGYSGSRKGMTTLQMRAVYRYLANIRLVNDQYGPEVEAHHGDCAGGDAQFHVIATVLGCRTVAHPPANSRLRAWCQADEIREPKDYLPRDWDIASETGELLAAPYTTVPVPRSGTWTTTGYAVQLGRPARVFMPHDGSLHDGRRFFGVPLPVMPENVVGS